MCLRVGVFGCGLVGVWCVWCEGLCGWVGVCFVVSDAHACASFRVFCFVVLVLLVCLVNNAAWAGWVGWCVLVGVLCGRVGGLVRRAGCVVRGGVLPAWLGDAVAGGGVGVSFGVGSRVFVLGGVSVAASVSGSVVPVSPGAGVAASLFGSASVGSVSFLASLFGSAPVSVGFASASGAVSVAECGGVVACVLCVVRVFGGGWCSLVLRRWGRAAGVGVGFGVRVCGWGVWVGVGGGVVSGGGVVLGWWGRARGRVCALVGGVGVKGLVLVGWVAVFCRRAGRCSLSPRVWGCGRRVWWVCVRVRVGAWRVCDCLCGCGVVSGARGVVLCAGRVDRLGEREEGTCLVGSLLSLLLFCGADDGGWSRCLHCGMVMLRLLSFIRSVFPVPGCSFFVCLRWGVERMTGVGPAAFTVVW